MDFFNAVTSRKAVKRLQVAVMTAVLFVAGSAHGGGAGADAHHLDSLIETIKKQAEQLEALRQEVEHLKAMTTAADTHAKEAMAEAQKKHGVVVYGSLRPSLTHSDFGDDSGTDVTDFFSRVGVKGHVDIREGLTAVYRGEWDADIGTDGDFGDARLAYVGLKTGLGKIAIGKQWDPHFNIVAGVTDIFNHRLSPFAWHETSPVRSNNLVTYAAQMGGLSLQAGARFDGSTEGSAPGAAKDEGTEPDDADAASIGIGYRMGPLYAGVSYLEEHGAEDYERSFTGVAASMDVTETLYLAVAYQDIEEENHTEDTIAEPVDGMGDGAVAHDHDDHDQSSLDLAAAMALGGGYKLKASYFDWDGDGNGRSFDGYNLTLENQLNDAVRVYAEWLQRDIEHGDEEDHLSIGIRYDFEAEL